MIQPIEFMTDGAGRIVCWPEQAERHFGISHAQAVGSSIVPLLRERGASIRDSMRRFLLGEPEAGRQIIECIEGLDADIEMWADGEGAGVLWKVSAIPHPVSEPDAAPESADPKVLVLS